MVLFRIVDADFLDTAAAADAAGQYVVVDPITGGGDRHRGRLAGGSVSHGSLFAGQQPGSYVLVVVRTGVLLVHAHARGADVVVRLQAAWQVRQALELYGRKKKKIKPSSTISSTRGPVAFLLYAGIIDTRQQRHILRGG